MMLLNYFKQIFQSVSTVNNSLLNPSMESSNTKSPFKHGSITNRNVLMKVKSVNIKTSNDNLIKRVDATNSKKLKPNQRHCAIGNSDYSRVNERDLKHIGKTLLFSFLKQKSENNLDRCNLNVENSNFKDNLGKLSKLELKDKMMNAHTSSVKGGLGKISSLNMKDKLISKGGGNPLKTNSGLADSLPMKKPKNMKDGLGKVSSLDMKEKNLSKGKDNLTQISKSELKEKIKRSETNKSKNESSFETVGRESIDTNDTAFQLSAFKDLEESNEELSDNRIGFDNDMQSTKPLLTFTSSSESIVSDVVGKPPKKLKKVSKKGSLEKEIIEDFQNPSFSVVDSSTKESSESSLEESSDEYSLTDESSVLTESMIGDTATSTKLKTLTGKKGETTEKNSKTDNPNKEKKKVNKGKSKKSDSKENVIKQPENSFDTSNLKKETTGGKSKKAVEIEKEPTLPIDNTDVLDKFQLKKEATGDKSESSVEKENKSSEWLEKSDIVNTSGVKTKPSGGKPKHSTAKENLGSSVIPKPPTGKLAKSPKNEIISKDKESAIIPQNSELKGKSEKNKNKVSKGENSVTKKNHRSINESSSDETSIEAEKKKEKNRKSPLKKNKNKDMSSIDDSETTNENENKNKRVKDEGITAKTQTKSKTTQKNRISGSISTDNSVALPTSNLSKSEKKTKSEKKSKVENSKTSKDKSESENNLTLPVPQISKGNQDDPGLFAENKQYNEITDVIPSRMLELRNLNVTSHCRVCESIFDCCCNCGCLMDKNRFPIFPSLKNNEMCRKICYKPLKKCQSMTVCRPIPSVNCKETSRYSSSCSDSLSLTYNCITDDSTCACVCPQRVICISR